MNNNFGIYDKSFSILKESLKDFPQIQRAWIFGSRALGTYKKGSDIDIALEGKDIDLGLVAKVYGVLNDELPLPYFCDVLDIKNIKTKELKEHIKHKGIIFYNKTACPNPSKQGKTV